MTTTRAEVVGRAKHNFRLRRAANMPRHQTWSCFTPSKASDPLGIIQLNYYRPITNRYMYSPLSSLNDSLHNTTRLLHTLSAATQCTRYKSHVISDRKTTRTPRNAEIYLRISPPTTTFAAIIPPKKGPRHRKKLSCSYYRTPGSWMSLLSPLCFLFLVGRWHVCYSRGIV